MIANYHTHTWRCRHAEGTEEEYIESALRSGIRILGFSDHTPYFFPGDYKSRIRMDPEQLPDYVQTLKKLREQYRGRIEIHIGLEAEYYPDLFPQLLEYLKESSIEYLILGQHRLGNGFDDIYCGWETSDESLLDRYCTQCTQAMETGLFTYFAHPDIFNFTGDEKIYRKYMRRLCREANRLGMPLEINFAGLEEGIQYPNPVFLETAAEENSTVIMGIDAHEPSAFGHRETEERILRFIEKLGLRLTDTVQLRPIL